MKRFVQTLVILAVAASALAPTAGKLPIRNGVLQNDGDANNHKWINLAEPNDPSDSATKNYVDTHGGGGGGGGAGLTSITLALPAVLFNPASIAFSIVGTDASGTAALANAPAATMLGNNDTGSAAAPAYLTVSQIKILLAINNLDNTSDANKPVSTATATALALKADTSAMTTALAAKADAAATTTALAGKEGILPTTTNDNWILARRNVANGSAWFFVDPVSLGGGGGGGGGTGTVTSVGRTNNVSSLFSVTVTNPTSSPLLTFDPVSQAANTFYGNGTGFSAAPTFMTPGTARTALGGTTAGQALFLMPNPNATTFARINPDNSVTLRTPAQLVLDLPVAGSSASGILTTSDWALFTAKENPLTFSPPFSRIGNNITATTGTTSTTLAVGNDNRFPAAVSGIRLGAGAGGADLAAAPNKNFVLDNQQTIGDADGPWTSTIRFLRQTAPMTAPRSTTLPPANGYAASSVIAYFDNLTTANFGRTFAPAGGDTLDGATSGRTPFIGGAKAGNKQARFVTDGINAWLSVGAGTIDHAEDPTDATKQGDFDVTGVTPGTRAHLRWTGNAVGVIPSTAAAATLWANGIDNNGNISYDAPALVPSTSGHAAGESLRVQSDGSYDFEPSNSGGSGYQVLDGTTNPIIWACVPGEQHQHAIVTLTGTPAAAHTLQVTGQASGNDFDLIVKQDSSGSRTISALPTNSLVGSAGAGVPTLTAAANAVDWIKGSYSGQTGAQWVWGVFQSNMTAAAPPACTTLGVTGATTGTTQMSQNTSAKIALANGFVADATSVCKIEANLMVTGPTANYDLKAYICPDTVRATIGSSSTTASSNVVSLGSTPNTTDIGQAVTLSAGYAAGTYYISAVDVVSTPKTITLVTTRGGATPANASSTVTGTVSVQIFGLPGTPVNASGSDPVNSLTLPTASGAADTTPAVFTNAGATGLTVGAFYFVKLAGQGTFGTPSWDTSDYISWLYSGTLSTGYNITASSAATGGTWTTPQTSRRMRFRTYH